MMGMIHTPHESQKAHHKDKLAETKKHDAAVHEALKAQQQQQREAKEQKQHEEARAHRAERALNLGTDPEGKHSKRAIKEQRELLRQAEKAASGVTCEHGVSRCRICFPHREEADKQHPHERGPPRGASVEVEDDE
ncbi:hypothetical protein Agub_g2892 [Astrephomene gubernaculifera]|uniref:Uncharacterized protein n=1 Tax=Astrephomene gubernaculifera TaxID=47775 RepID=A0AAD3DHR9_9CHLO|nr:hypothetical protein Agub_g2892 [Astrephomene gubernaculifera]